MNRNPNFGLRISKIPTVFKWIKFNCDIFATKDITLTSIKRYKLISLIVNKFLMTNLNISRILHKLLLMTTHNSIYEIDYKFKGRKEDLRILDQNLIRYISKSFKLVLKPSTEFRQKNEFAKSMKILSRKINRTKKVQIHSNQTETLVNAISSPRLFKIQNQIILAGSESMFHQSNKSDFDLKKFSKLDFIQLQDLQVKLFNINTPETFDLGDLKAPMMKKLTICLQECSKTYNVNFCLEKFPNLEYLDFYLKIDMPKVDFGKPTRNLKSLRFEFENWKKIVYRPIWENIKETFKNLEVLRAKFKFPIISEKFFSFGEFQNLKDLEFEIISNMSEEPRIRYDAFHLSSLSCKMSDTISFECKSKLKKLYLILTFPQLKKNEKNILSEFSSLEDLNLKFLYTKEFQEYDIDFEMTHLKILKMVIENQLKSLNIIIRSNMIERINLDITMRCSLKNDFCITLPKINNLFELLLPEKFMENYEGTITNSMIEKFCSYVDSRKIPVREFIKDAQGDNIEIDLRYLSQLMKLFFALGSKLGSRISKNLFRNDFIDDNMDFNFQIPLNPATDFHLNTYNIMINDDYVTRFLDKIFVFHPKLQYMTLILPNKDCLDLTFKDFSMLRKIKIEIVQKVWPREIRIKLINNKKLQNLRFYRACFDITQNKGFFIVENCPDFSKFSVNTAFGFNDTAYKIFLNWLLNGMKTDEAVDLIDLRIILSLKNLLSKYKFPSETLFYCMKKGFQCYTSCLELFKPNDKILDEKLFESIVSKCLNRVKVFKVSCVSQNFKQLSLNFENVENLISLKVFISKMLYLETLSLEFNIQKRFTSENYELNQCPMLKNLNIKLKHTPSDIFFIQIRECPEIKDLKIEIGSQLKCRKIGISNNEEKSDKILKNHLNLNLTSQDLFNLEYLKISNESSRDFILTRSPNITINATDISLIHQDTSRSLIFSRPTKTLTIVNIDENIEKYSRFLSSISENDLENIINLNLRFNSEIEGEEEVLRFFQSNSKKLVKVKNLKLVFANQQFIKKVTIDLSNYFPILERLILEIANCISLEEFKFGLENLRSLRLYDLSINKCNDLVLLETDVKSLEFFNSLKISLKDSEKLSKKFIENMPQLKNEFKHLEAFFLSINFKQ